MTAPITPGGTPVPRIEVGDPEWLQIMSASKIAAVLGLSPWESRFSLYHRMTGAITDTGNDATRRGNYLEAGVVAWFADQNPSFAVEKTGTWLHRDRRWQAATPDRLLTLPDQNVELLEVKTSSMEEGWGDGGSDQIPVYYRAQVIWQLDTLGLKRCHVAVLLPYLEFRSYVIDYDEAEAEFMRAAATEFLNDLEQGNRPPIDDSTATYKVVRELHPEIDGEDVEVPADLADEFLDAIDAEYDAKTAARQARTRMADAMGSARYAIANGTRIARRQTTDGCTPYVVACQSTKQRRSAAA
jgi:putative phage-type endonuclease